MSTSARPTPARKILVIGSLAESLVNFRGDLLRSLVASGCTVTAAAPAGPVWVDNKLRQWGVRRAVLPMNRTGVSLAQDLALLASLWRLVRSERPDAVLGYTIKPVVFGSLAAWLAGVPRKVAMITGLGFAFMDATSSRQRAVQRVARALYWLALRCADVVLFQNGDDEAALRSFGLLPAGADSRRIAGSGVNLERFPRQSLPSGQRRFLLVARLLRDKGVREYFAAATRIRTTHPGIECDLVGPLDSNPSAVTAQELQEAIVSGAVRYHGAVDDVRPFLRDCHVYVLPSYREGMPRSVLEAMATGRPIITTDAPGCRETVEVGVNGMLVPVGDSSALADAMAHYAEIDDASLETQATASRRLAEQRFAVQRVNADILDALGVTVAGTER